MSCCRCARQHRGRTAQVRRSMPVGGSERTGEVGVLERATPSGTRRTRSAYHPRRRTPARSDAELNDAVADVDNSNMTLTARVDLVCV